MKIYNADNSGKFNEVEVIIEIGGSTHTTRSVEIHTYLNQGIYKSIISTLTSYVRGEDCFTCVIEDCTIIVNSGTINGVRKTKGEILNLLARVIFKGCFDKDPLSLTKFLFSQILIPSQVAYALENRVPYKFYREGSYSAIQVRLNVKQISSKECAIEISDGLWGNITMNDLCVFVNTYRDGAKRGKWVRLSPFRLYEKLLGEPPTDAQHNLMVGFLMQNRQGDMVERKANELVANMVAKYPTRLLHKTIINDREKEVQCLYVKGQLYDWKLEENANQSKVSNQRVKTYVWNITYADETEGKWVGPICIDNITNKSSLGDQFISRVMPMLNDSIIRKLINTVGSYLKREMPRMSFEEMEATE